MLTLSLTQWFFSLVVVIILRPENPEDAAGITGHFRLSLPTFPGAFVFVPNPRSLQENTKIHKGERDHWACL